MIQSIVLLAIYGICSAFGLLLIKKFTLTLKIDFLAISGFFLYGFGFLIWLYILKKMPLSSAFPIASGILIIGTSILGLLFLNEKISYLKIVGLLFIFIGICIVMILGDSCVNE